MERVAIIESDPPYCCFSQNQIFFSDMRNNATIGCIRYICPRVGEGVLEKQFMQAHASFVDKHVV